MNLLQMMAVKSTKVTCTAIDEDLAENDKFMKDDGTYDDFLNGFNFNNGDLEEELTPLVNMYNGRVPSLCHGVARMVMTSIECVEVVGAIAYDFFCSLTANSNQYAQYHMNEKGEFRGSSWCNISVQEMAQFLGVLLKMSVDNRELGGYPAFLLSLFQ